MSWRDNPTMCHGTRDLPDGRVADVLPLTFGRARLVVSSSRESYTYQDGW